MDNKKHIIDEILDDLHVKISKNKISIKKISDETGINRYTVNKVLLGSGKVEALKEIITTVDRLIKHPTTSNLFFEMLKKEEEKIANGTSIPMTKEEQFEALEEHYKFLETEEEKTFHKDVYVRFKKEFINFSYETPDEEIKKFFKPFMDSVEKYYNNHKEEFKERSTFRDTLLKVDLKEFINEKKFKKDNYKCFEINED